MAVGTLQDSTAALRAATFRLSLTPSKQLPYIAPQIAAQLWNCKDLLSSTADTAKQGNDASVTVHRFKTYLSTLLQDRTIEGRWSAVVLVKATIEAGGVEVLSKSNAWVRNLLGVLKKPDPPTTRNLAVITLTRIFMLTWDYSNLIREITTPALPTFISVCLSNAENKRCSASELQTVLEAFVTLMPRHPTIFRTNETQIRTLLTRIISASSSNVLSDVHYTKDQQAVAQHLLTLLHHCSPKQGAAEKWDETLKATVAAAHATCDRVFISIAETWKSNAGVQLSAPRSMLFHGEPELEGNDALGLNPWKGVFAGNERLVSLLDTLKSHLSTGSAGAVTVRLGQVVDLLVRVFSVRKGAMQTNNEVSKEEREAMLSDLPSVHVAAMRLVEAILRRFGSASASIVQPLLTDIISVFGAERSNVTLRTATYAVLTTVLHLQGPSMQRHDVVDVECIVKACCQDLLPTNEAVASVPSANVNGAYGKQSLASNDLNLQASCVKASRPTSLTGLQKAAEALLPVCLSKLNPAYVPGRLRVFMDRTAILTEHKDALIASVLSPPLKGSTDIMQTSLLPLLARQHALAPEVEALLRPRLPVIKTGHAAAREDAEEDDEDEDDMVNGVADGYVDQEDEAADGAQDGLEPTDGLLSALGQTEDVAESEDLYSASPMRHSVEDTSGGASTTQAPAASAANAPPSEKRRADAAPDNQRSAKRVQASPVAETLLPNAADSLPGLDLVTAQSHVPATVVAEQPPSSFVTAPEPSQQSITLPSAPVEPSSAGTAQGSAYVASDDDMSDSEIPQLTMELSDEESEDDDEQE